MDRVQKHMWNVEESFMRVEFWENLTETRIFLYLKVDPDSFSFPFFPLKMPKRKILDEQEEEKLIRDNASKWIYYLLISFTINYSRPT